MDFLIKFLENNYSVNFAKFWRNSINLKSANGKSLCETNRTFQWAELVAKMYKVLGILGEDEHSGKFVPVHFTQKRNINLKKGSFGPECMIQMPDIVQ